MIRTVEEILADIDGTLDRLIENADVIKDISLKTLFACEVEALQKTQESLLARLVHMQDLLKGQKKNEGSEKKDTFDSIEDKIVRFGKLNAQIIDRVAVRMRRTRRSHQPRVRPHRRKDKVAC